MSGRPYGTTREEFVETKLGQAVPDWLAATEERYGLLERIASISMKDGRLFVLARFATAWMVNIYNPGNAQSERELSCFLSFEAMTAFWGLHAYLTTQETQDKGWDAFMQVLGPVEEEPTP